MAWEAGRKGGTVDVTPATLRRKTSFRETLQYRRCPTGDGIPVVIAATVDKGRDGIPGVFAAAGDKG
jgi:hypothetical protein